jgi:hypothetical protein
LNDLWKYKENYWTWISGSSVGNQIGYYGNMGVPSPNNVPGSRQLSSNWIDSEGNFWVFGGTGYFTQSENKGDL